MKKELLNLFKAARLKRTLLILTMILIPAAYLNVFPSSILSLALVIIFIYSSAGISNACKDKDYKLPKYSFFVIISLIFVALLISLTNKIILLSALAGIFLGYVYNNLSRYVTYGDSLIAGITHISLPILTSSLLVGLPLLKTIQLATVGYLLALSIGPITNLKDIKKDKRLGYKTLVNAIKNPKKLSIIFLNISFIIIIIFFLSLDIKPILLLSLIPSFILVIIIKSKISKNNFESALNLMRLYLISSFVIIILLLALNPYIFISGISILFLYTLTLMSGFFKKFRIKWKLMTSL